MTCVLEVNALDGQALNQLQIITPTLPDFMFVGRVQVLPDNKFVAFNTNAKI